MLFNTKWKKSDALSIDSLISWLETKRGSYKANHVDECLLCQYFKAMGYGKVSCSHAYFAEDGGEWVDLPLGFDEISTWGKPTFKSALKRAKVWKTQLDAFRAGPDE